MTGPVRLAQGQNIEAAAVTLADAQVHATLALAAVTAIPGSGDMPPADCDAWHHAAGWRPDREGAASDA